ncbi:MAG: transposase [Leptospirales bacterium]
MGVSIAEATPLERGRPVVLGCLCRCRIRPRDFLHQLQTELPEPIAVAWDNLTGHWTKIVQGHIRSSERLKDTFLPPYAPELNPVEYIWSYLKKIPSPIALPMMMIWKSSIG